jgi:tRNA threonylcarbamoyl adenosine modification protein YjeE
MLTPFLTPYLPLQHTLTLTEEQLPAFANAIVANATPNMVLSLEGNLGTGKTTLARYIGEALQIPVRVTSPTFVYYNQYPIIDNPTGVQQLIHADCYRLAETVAEAHTTATDNWLIAELLTLQQQTPTLLVVEWGSILAARLQPIITHHLQIKTVSDETLSETESVTRQYQWFGSHPLTLEIAPSE